MHSHSWDLLSHVLHGSVRNELIEVDRRARRPGTGGSTRCAASPTVDEMAATDRLVTAATATVETHSAGDSYALRAGGFHTSEVAAGQPAVTVALGRDHSRRVRPEPRRGRTGAATGYAGTAATRRRPHGWRGRSRDWWHGADWLEEPWT